LDELPQFFNVLKGDMSLVGPRPIVPPEIHKYGDYSRLFMSVKPGLTGNWQVNGRSEVSDYSRRTALDIEYIRDQSLKTDIDILLKTIAAVLSRRGAH
jgi:lipopolysaccharide/colanic/teichoic acid biosynthesis glycosyltransferase